MSEAKIGKNMIDPKNKNVFGYSKKSYIFALLYFFITLLLQASDVPAQNYTITKVRSQGFVEGAISKMAPYEDKKRLIIYQKISALHERLWLKPTRIETIMKKKTSAIPGFPYLSIEDRDGDGRGDFFGYYSTANSKDTKEFGSIFDLNQDGRADWIVFYGGSMIADGGGFNIVLWNYHAVDRNGDDRTDMLIIDCVDTDGDGRIMPGVTLWLYDSNFDGRLDNGQHIYKGKTSTLKSKGGRLSTGFVLLDGTKDKQPIVGRRMPADLFDKIFQDLP